MDKLKDYLSGRNIRGVVFDLWFTLIEPVEKDREIKTSRITGVDIEKVRNVWESLMTIEFYSTLKFVETLMGSLEIYVRSKEYENIKKSLLRYYGTDALKSDLYDDVYETLDFLVKRHFKLGILSNVHSPYKEPFYQYGLQNFFDVVCFSDEMRVIKPHYPAFYNVLERMKLNPKEVLLVGDDFENDIKPANSLKMPALLLDREDKKDYFPKINSLKTLVKILE